MQTMAKGWLSLQLSNNAFIVGLVASVGALPIVIMSMHAGAFVDRGNHIRLVRITQSVMLLQAAALWACTWLSVISVPLLLVLAFVQGMCNAVEIPARQSDDCAACWPRRFAARHRAQLQRLRSGANHWSGHWCNCHSSIRHFVVTELNATSFAKVWED